MWVTDSDPTSQSCSFPRVTLFTESSEDLPPSTPDDFNTCMKTPTPSPRWSCITAIVSCLDLGCLVVDFVIDHAIRLRLATVTDSSTLRCALELPFHTNVGLMDHKIHCSQPCLYRFADPANRNLQPGRAVSCQGVVRNVRIYRGCRRARYFAIARRCPCLWTREAREVLPSFDL